MELGFILGGFVAIFMFGYIVRWAQENRAFPWQ